ncbi:unnamed protein product, partial [Adineta steineri]
PFNTRVKSQQSFIPLTNNNKRTGGGARIIISNYSQNNNRSRQPGDGQIKKFSNV